MRKLWIILILFAVLCPSFGLAAPDTNEVKKKIILPRIRLNPEILQLIQKGSFKPALERMIGVHKGGFADPGLKRYISYCYDELAAKAMKGKKFEESISLLNKSIQYSGDQVHPYIGLGFSHFSLSRYEEAENAYSKALSFAPEDLQANLMMGEICYLTNRLTESKEYWERVLEIDPNNKFVKKRMTGLKKTIRLSEDHEKEEDLMFSVSFDGSKNPRLREIVLNMLSDISETIGQELQLYPTRQIPVILLTNKAFLDITGTPDWVGGVYEGHIKIPVDNYKIEPLKQVLTHEYIHAVIYDHLSYRCPWWLNEGIAQYFSGDIGGNRKKLNLAAKIIKKDSVPELDKLVALLKGGDPSKVKKAYTLALSAVHYFIETYGTYDLQYILELMAEGKSFESIVAEITGFTFKQFQENWKISHI